MKHTIKQSNVIVNNRFKMGACALGFAAGAIALLPAGTAFAAGTITNTATANGTPARGTLTAPTADASVSIEDATPSLTVEKTVTSLSVANGSVSDEVDAGDIITFRVEVTNTGDQTLTGLSLSDDGPTFNSETGGATLSAFSLDTNDADNTATSATELPIDGVAVFTATYTLTESDFLHGSQAENGISNTVSVTSTEVTTAQTSTVTHNIPAYPSLSVTKSAALTETNGTASDNLAAVGDTIQYVYEVENTGNVPITNVSISDAHEGGTDHATTLSSSDDMTNEELVSDGPLASATSSVASADATDDGTTAADGVWDTLQPGAKVKFTYTHTVTQAEFDAQ